MLARREYTRHELMVTLQEKYREDLSIATILDEFQVKGWQSDQRFAESYLQMCLNKGWGELRIKQGLKTKGISEEIISSVFEQDSVFWLKQLARCWRKRFHGKWPENAAEQAKQIKFLLYRGFASEQIHQFLKQRDDDESTE